MTASEDGTGRFWDARTGELLAPVLRHPGWVLAVRLNRENTAAATASTDRTARIWDLTTGKILLSTSRHGRLVEDLRFSPDSRWLATASDDGTARIWDIRSGSLVSETLVHRRRVHTVQFSPDGDRILTASTDGTARLWDSPRLPAPGPSWLPRLAEAIGGRRLNDLRQLEPVPFGELVQIKKQVEESRSLDPYTQWAKWFFADRSSRPQSPASGMSLRKPK